MFLAHYEIKLNKIGRIELELFKFKKWTHKKNTMYNIWWIYYNKIDGN